MAQLVFLPHERICPNGAVVEAQPGTTIIDAALAGGVVLEHACEKSCVCTTCHVIVREGFESLAAAGEQEEDVLDKAWGLEPESRLSCRAIVGDANLLIEIPRYTINLISEQSH